MDRQHLQLHPTGVFVVPVPGKGLAAQLVKGALQEAQARQVGVHETALGEHEVGKRQGIHVTAQDALQRAELLQVQAGELLAQALAHLSSEARWQVHPQVRFGLRRGRFLKNEQKAARVRGCK